MSSRSLDFHALTDWANTPDEGFDAIRTSSLALMSAELAAYGRLIRLPPWTADLGDGRRSCVTAWSPSCASPSTSCCSSRTGRCCGNAGWPGIRGYASTLVTEGLSAVLANLHPCIRWRPPYLEISRAGGYDGTYHLHGRGLIITHSVFCWPDPIISASLLNCSASPTLIVPAMTGPTDLASSLMPQPRATRGA